MLRNNNIFKLLLCAWIITLFIITDHLYLRDDTCGGPALERAEAEKTPFRIINKVLTHDDAIRQKFQTTVDLKLQPKDPLVIELVTEMLDPPSDHMPKGLYAKPTKQSQYISDNFFKGKKKGFFVECGALDGDRSSNTVWLEQVHMWTGLLIEADPYFYTQLMGKNRRSWSINACLSPYNHTGWLTFIEKTDGTGSIVEENRFAAKMKPTETMFVPCFPLESFLTALNRTQVDYFSLDVEGSELSVLQTIPHSRLNITTWTIEHDKVGRTKLRILMEKLGYKAVHYIEGTANVYAADIVFKKV